MDQAQIAALLAPFLVDNQQPIADSLLAKLSTYLELLLKWNARTNLTSVRTPVEIVARHFGESIFAAQYLFPDPTTTAVLADIGSGAGFPGLPIKLWASKLRVTLVESHSKKSTFLREVVRALPLTGVEVFAGRAEDLAANLNSAIQGTQEITREGHDVSRATPAPPNRGLQPLGSTPLFDVVTLRAVEQFDRILPIAATLLQPNGRLALMIGDEQIPIAASTLPKFQWENTVTIPNSRNRVLLAGRPTQEPN